MVDYAYPHFNVHVISAATDDPPRPTFDSVLSRDMAGYMPARADFMEVRGDRGLGMEHVCTTIVFELFWDVI